MFRLCLIFYGIYCLLYKVSCLKPSRRSADLCVYCTKMSNEVKFRKKTQPAKNSNLSEPAKTNGKDEAEKEKMAHGNSVNKPSGSSSLDFKMCVCLLTIALCGVLTW